MGTHLVDDSRSMIWASESVGPFSEEQAQDPNNLCLLRVNFYDTTSGKCMYERWFLEEEQVPSGAASRRDQVGSFVNVLYQFAREIDSGSISRVMYEDVQQFREDDEGYGITEMVTECSQGVTITVFHGSCNHRLVQRFAHDLLASFLESHRDLVSWGADGDPVSSRLPALDQAIDVLRATYARDAPSMPLE